MGANEKPEPGEPSRRNHGEVVRQGPKSEPQSTIDVWILGDGSPVSVFGPSDARIAAIVERQRGRVARGQLLDAGLSRSSITRRLRNGRLTQQHPGVYRVGPDVEIEFGEETAALLATRPNSYLAGHSAATLLGIRPGIARPIHVVVPYSSQTGDPDGVKVHRSAILTRKDVTVHKGLPVTSPARTLLDIAIELPDTDVELALEIGRASCRERVSYHV